MPKMMKPKMRFKKEKPRKQPSMFESTPKESVKNDINILEDAPGTNTEVTFKIRPRISFVVSCSKHTTTKKGFIGSSHFNSVGEFHNIQAAWQTADILMDANKRHKDCKLVFELPDEWFQQQLKAFTEMQARAAAATDDKPKKPKAKAKPDYTETEEYVKNATKLRKMLLVNKGKKKKRKRV